MDLATLAAVAAAVVATGAMAVAIFQADAAREQVKAAKRQVTAAKEQAEAARDQADAAWQQVEVAKEQVAEARRANEEVAAERAERRAREAVRWEAEVTPDWESIKVRNTGAETAWHVQVQVHGADEDWTARWMNEDRGGEPFDFEEIRAGDYFPYYLPDEDPYPPEQLYVYWRGAPHPTAVVVKGAPPT